MQRGRAITDKRTADQDSVLYLRCPQVRSMAITEAMVSRCRDGALCTPCQQRQRRAHSNNPTMTCRHRKMLGPVFCIVQVIAFIAITTFIMGLPLGDPNIWCADSSTHGCSGTEISKCVVCYVYNTLLSISVQVINLFDAFQKNMMYCLKDMHNALMASLHQIKLQMYHILQHFDGKDFCETCNLTCDKVSRGTGDERSQISVSKADMKST